jgi:peptide/nickel transport system ATP-binding protein
VSDVVLEVQDLTVHAGHGGPPIVEGLDLLVREGEIIGVVGESGSGKSTLGLAILGYGRDGAVITGGDVRIAGRSLVTSKPSEVLRLRGDLVAYVPQDPASSLNPSRRIGAQLREVLDLAGPRPGAPAPAERIAAGMREVGLPDDATFLRRYPHELSGGQQQRVLLALAFLRDPRVVVLDEPTTGLDVTTQAHVLATVREVCHRRGTAAIYISHDLDVVASSATRVLVLYGGRTAEYADTAELFAAPRHRYTAALLASAPKLDPGARVSGIPGHAPRLSEKPSGCAFRARCSAADDRCAERPPAVQVSPAHVHHCFHPVTGGTASPDHPRAERSARTTTPVSTLAATAVRAAYGHDTVLHGVDLHVRRGECVALVGESGSGKTTLSKCISGLHARSGGTIAIDGHPLAALSTQRSVSERRAIQYVFQNPYGSLNPRRTVRALLEQPGKALGLGGVDARHWLERVNLRSHVLDQRPRQLSGGERQRVAIARALTTQPDFLICDEITSALDVSIQASVVNLLLDLQEETGVGILFVTHNLPLVAALADRVVVMKDGSIAEEGLIEPVLRQPQTAYTRELLDAVPTGAATHRSVV